MQPLAGLKILVPESRELSMFTAMLEAEGATVLRCPLVRILDLDDGADADRWISQCIAGDFDDVVLLTGEGLRRLLTLSGARHHALVAALASGEIGMIAFTATPQIGRLVEVAQQCGLTRMLGRGLAITPIASICPIVDEKLRQHGFAATVRPDSSFHLKPLVRAITVWRQA